MLCPGNIIPLEMFEWMVGGDVLEFEVLDLCLDLSPNQLQVLKQIALGWEHSSKIGKGK